MSHHAPGRPKLGITTGPHDLSLVTFPLETMHDVTHDVARAALSLTALVELFKTGSLGNEEACLPHLLSYIVDDLQQCNENIGQYMTVRTDLGNGGNHA